MLDFIQMFFKLFFFFSDCLKLGVVYVVNFLFKCLDVTLNLLSSFLQKISSKFPETPSSETFSKI